MLAEMEYYAAVLEETKAEIKDLIKELDSETLNWMPLTTDSNSIYQLVTHICGSEAQSVHKAIGGRPFDRDRDAEFEASGTESSVLQALLDSTANVTRAVLGEIGFESLDETRDTGTSAGAMTIRRIILRQIHHNALHLGHIQLTKQLYETR